MSGSGVGCYYDNSYEEAIYGKQRISEIPVHIRYYKDSFISADEMTLGCSSSSTSSTNCFGMSQSEQNKTGAIVTVVGAILIVIEVGAIVAMCFCCKDTIKSFAGKKDTLLKKDKQDIPYGQPVYGQPVYGQPNYGQPNYGIPQN